MRVVAGQFKGRRLRAPAGSRTRPTADRVREALFAILGPVDGLSVLDLFAGSGALGIEALSRGAAAATFVDSDARAVAAIRANLAAVGTEGRILKRDVRRFLMHETAQHDLVLCDPPYSSAGRLAGLLSESLPRVATDSARIVTESDKRDPLRLELPLEFERAYGDTLIAIHRAR